MKVWFKKFNIFYFPISWQGFIISILALAFCIQIFLFIDGRSHSISDLLYGVFPYIVPTFLLYIWIAKEKSK